MEYGKLTESGMPSEKEVRQALAKLVVHGVDAVWSPDVQPLLHLPSVQARVAALGEPSAAEALREVLQEAVADLGQSQYRSLLTIVLGLIPEYEELSAGDKRALAGRQFRGGRKPVSAGTIRQHHEPRALDQLASLLISLSAEPDRQSSRSGSDESVLWHPEVHRRWAEERLVFWRMGFIPYRRAEALEGLAQAMQASGVLSWSVHELFGAYDVLVKAWIPAAGSEARIRDNVVSELRSIDLLQTLTVERIVTEALWRSVDGISRQPSEAALAHMPSAGEIARINSATSGLERYEDEGLIARRGAPSGIRFFIALSQSSASVGALARSRLDTWVMEVVRGARSLSDVSIYAGTGFATFLIEGVVQPQDFHVLSDELLERLEPLDQIASQRIETMISPTTQPVFQVEEMRGGKPVGDRDIEHLLRQEEDPHFEVKATAFTELRRLEPQDNPTELPTSKAAIDSLMKAIVAFLNTEGGDLVIGAIDEETAERSPRLRKSRLVSSAPRIGLYLATGIDHELAGDSDRYLRRLQELCRTSIEPDPSVFLKIGIEQVQGRTICLIQVEGAPRDWFYFRGKEKSLQFLVRQGSLVRELMGPDADRYKTSAPRA